MARALHWRGRRIYKLLLLFYCYLYFYYYNTAAACQIVKLLFATFLYPTTKYTVNAILIILFYHEPMQ